MNLLRKTANYFGLSRTEKNGALMLIFLILLSTSSLLFSQIFFVREWSPEDENVNQKIGNFVASQQETVQSKNNYYAYHKNEYNYYKKNDSKNAQKENNHSAEKHNFISDKRKIIVALNDADTLDLQQIKGIGAVFARRIVNYREKLGGFVDKEQLKEVYGIDSLKYETLKDGISIDMTKIRLINLNKVSLDELKKHPYVDYYQAKEIVKYREKYGAFKQKSELKNVNLMDERTFYKIERYITIE